MPVKNPSTTLRTGIIPGQRVAKEKLERARELRRDMTPAEMILWQELRGNKFGVHFRRHTCLVCYEMLTHFKNPERCQGQVIAGFIVDFHCHKAALVVEVDGDIHDLQQEEPPPTFGHLPQIPRTWNLGEAGWGCVRWG